MGGPCWARVLFLDTLCAAPAGSLASRSFLGLWICQGSVLARRLTAWFSTHGVGIAMSSCVSLWLALFSKHNRHNESMRKLTRRSTLSLAALCPGHVLGNLTVTEPADGRNISADKALSSTNDAGFTSLGSIVVIPGESPGAASCICLGVKPERGPIAGAGVLR